MDDRRKARNYFPLPKFQIRFLGYLLLGTLAQIGMTVATLYYVVNQNYTLFVKYTDLAPEMTQLLYRELNVMTGLIAGTFVLMFIGISFLGVMYSHKVAGPIYAVFRTLRQINSGNLVELQFRKGDEFQELVEEFNHMVRQLKDTGRRAS